MYIGRSNIQSLLVQGMGATLLGSLMMPIMVLPMLPV